MTRPCNWVELKSCPFVLSNQSTVLRFQKKQLCEVNTKEIEKLHRPAVTAQWNHRDPVSTSSMSLAELVFVAAWLLVPHAFSNPLHEATIHIQKTIQQSWFMGRDGPGAVLELLCQALKVVRPRDNGDIM